jgi:hypothetical protein
LSIWAVFEGVIDLQTSGKNPKILPVKKTYSRFKLSALTAV